MGCPSAVRSWGARGDRGGVSAPRALPRIAWRWDTRARLSRNSPVCGGGSVWLRRLAGYSRVERPVSAPNHQKGCDAFASAARARDGAWHCRADCRDRHHRHHRAHPLGSLRCSVVPPRAGSSFVMTGACRSGKVGRWPGRPPESGRGRATSAGDRRGLEVGVRAITSSTISSATRCGERTSGWDWR